MTFSLFSLNLWNLNQDVGDRMRRLDTYLSNSKPDVACFQEVSPLELGGRPQTDLLCKQTPQMTRCYSAQTLWDDREEGLVTLCGLPLIAFDSFKLPRAPGDGQRQLQISVLKYRRQKFIIANTHLAFRENQDNVRVAQVETILRYLSSAAAHHGTDALILVGDFNATPQSPPVSNVLKDQLGLRDIFAKAESRRTQFTYPAEGTYAEAEATNRWIDYIFATDHFDVKSLGLSLNGGRTGDYVSDHVALEAIFHLAG
jgi:endonuclease/exonuclease/phosphatase family metal-dependent hydrolase